MLRFQSHKNRSTEVSQFLDRAHGMGSFRINAYTTLINGLVIDGVWPLLDALYITATDTQANANLNLVSSSYPLIETGSPTFTADKGYTLVDANTVNYVLTGFNPNTASSPKYTLNSAHYSIWQSNSAAVSASIGIGGTSPFNIVEVILINFSGTTNIYRSHTGQTGGATGASGATNDGNFVVNRPDSATQTAYRSGIFEGTETRNQDGAVPNVGLGFGCENDSGTVICRGGVYRSGSIGSALNNTTALALHTRISDYMTAVGAT